MKRTAACLSPLHLIALLLPLLVVGCGRSLMPTPNLYAYGSRTEWQNVPAALQSNTVDVLYATDRVATEGDRGPSYNTDRSLSLAFGLCTVALGPDLSWNELVDASRQQRRRRVPLAIEQVREVGRFPDTPWDFDVIDGEAVTEPTVVRNYAAARKQVQELLAMQLKTARRKEAYLFIHGFNNYFDDAVFVMGEFWHFAGREGVPIAYSWPAGGGISFRGYNEDRESGEFTVFHLKQFLEAIADTPELEKLHLIAHSRGTDVLASALRELNIKYRAKGADPAQALKIGNLVFAAPDIDLEVAMQRIEAERITRICERLTVYSSPDDRALAMANWLFRSAVRLGSLTFAELPAERRFELAKLRDVSFIIADVDDGYLGHSYFYKNPAVSSDLILLIRDNRPPGAEHGRPLRKNDEGTWVIDDDYLKSQRESLRPAAQPAQ